jgi:hypothetical protein
LNATRAFGWSSHANALCTVSEQLFAVGCKPHGSEKVADTVLRQCPVNPGKVATRLIEPAGERQRQGGDRQDMCMRIWTCGGLDTPVGRFLEAAQTDERHGADAKHAEQQRIERAQMA